MEGSTSHDRIAVDDDGALDEVVLTNCTAHLERMRDDGWFLGLTAGPRSLGIWLNRDGKAIVATYEQRGEDKMPVTAWDEGGG